MALVKCWRLANHFAVESIDSLLRIVKCFNFQQSRSLRNFIRNLQKTGKKINWLEGTRPLVRAIFWAHLGINQNCFTSKRFSEIKNTYCCRLVLIRMIYANFAWLSRPFLYSLAFAKFVLHHTRKDSVLLRYPVSC